MDDISLRYTYNADDAPTVIDSLDTERMRRVWPWVRLADTLDGEDNEHGPAHRLTLDALRVCVERLKEPHYSAICMRFGLHYGVMHSLDDIARVQSTTRERARQRVGVALAKLRGYVRDSLSAA